MNWRNSKLLEFLMERFWIIVIVVPIIWLYAWMPFIAPVVGLLLTVLFFVFLIHGSDYGDEITSKIVLGLSLLAVIIITLYKAESFVQINEFVRYDKNVSFIWNESGEGNLNAVIYDKNSSKEKYTVKLSPEVLKHGSFDVNITSANDIWFHEASTVYTVVKSIK